MQPESLLMGAGTSMAVTSHWKSNEMLNWSMVTQGNATALGDMEMPGNSRSHYGQFSPSTSVLLAVLMTLLVFATVLGNALVILAFAVEKSLRTQGNFFFLNLAIADLLVGGFCIPVYIPYVITGEWRLGRGLCKIWLVVDYTLCTASVFNIVLISFDRFISVTQAVSYRCQKGVTREAVLKMMSVWLAAFLLYGPAIIIWERRNQVRDEQPVEGPGDCEMEALKAGVQHVFFVRPVEGEAQRIPDNAARLGGILSTAKVSAVTGNSNHETSKDGTILDLPPLQVGDVVQHSRRTRFQSAEHSFSKQCSRSEVAASRFRLSKDKKVAKSLAVIVCVFGLCWAPYTLLMIIRAACHAQCVQHYLYEISFWLLWVNSSINPVLYPLCHTSFRKAFRKLLCTTKIKIQPQYMEQMY
ncbi:histamine H3 receptor isoform X3 [Salmo trutta]|uniref:histamine H3 receptor isoform X3 n=1 Tax=Salmo trutta TaxID=8032 RepID=UPI0011307275|nr:histamine H3 receptor-like isoform X3 [Salmo trutta]